MSANHGWIPTIIGFLIALLVGMVLGSLVQTQFNLVALQGLGVEISLGTRLETSWHDLLRFAPVYAALFITGFLPSQVVALLLLRSLGGRFRVLISAVAAAVGLLVTLKVVDALAPMPTLIAATRGIFGLCAMLLTAAVAGWLFVALQGRLAKRSGQHGVAGVVVLVVACGLTSMAQPVQAQSDSPYQITTVAEDLEHPWSLAFLADGRMLVTERPGRLRLLSPQGDTLVASVSGVPEVHASGQSGLFEVLPSPQFAENQTVFLSYACGNVDANHTCLAKGILKEGGLQQVTEIFRAQPAKVANAHFGGRMVWLADNTLVLTLGDGFDYREQAQNLHNHLGSTVRLNSDGSVPDDNPFVDRDSVDQNGSAQNRVRPEIYTYGHRNVQGLVYDADNQRLIAHEHGPRGGDEINILEAGDNYGWPIATYGLDYTWARVTPFEEYPGTSLPALQWTPSIAPSGMALYTGELFPQWQGDLLVGALVPRQVRRVTLSGDGNGAKEVGSLFAELGERIRDVRVGPDGAVYLLTDSAEGRVLRVTPAP